MNKYEADPDEFERVTRMIAAGPMRVSQLAGMMLVQDMGAYARTLGIKPGTLREPQLARAILKRLIGYVPAEYVPPAPKRLPEVAWCDCENPKELTYWAHAREGRPVTTHIDMKGAPQIDSYTDSAVYKQLEFWADLSNGGLKVARVDVKKDANITVKHGDLTGNRLGVTIKRFYENGHMVSAEIIIDNTRDWAQHFSNALAGILLSVRHEFGHGLGGPHTLDEADILYPSPTQANIHRQAGPGDRAWIALGYPATVPA